MFEQERIPDMATIAQRAERELREWVRRDVCASQEGDDEFVLSIKERTVREFESSRPTAEILGSFLIDMRQAYARSGKAEAGKFLAGLQNTKTDGERIPLFLNYYGLDTPAGGENGNNPTSPIMKSFKAKYRSMFEQGAGHELVEEEMRRDVGDKREQELSGLRKKLAGLELARSAAEKERARREERARERRGRESEKEKERERKVVRCGLQGCQREVDVDIEGGPIQCAVCDWLAARAGEKEEGTKRVFYCCVEHGEVDFVSSPHHGSEYEANMVVGNPR